MPELDFVDTHVHFFDLRDPNLVYSWLQPGRRHPLLGDIGAVQAQRYWADDFLAETRFAGVKKSVHVQAAIGIEDPVEETRWLQAFSDRLGHPHGIVAGIHLADADVEDSINRHRQFLNLRGVRDRPSGDHLVDPAWQRGFSLLGKYGLVACVDASLDAFAKVKNLATRFPDITVSLDHAGFPRARTEDYFRMWRSALIDLAQAPNVVIKISGLGMCDPGWTIESLRPWILSCIEAFGVHRSFFGTNWPVDRLFSSYPDVVHAYADIIADFAGEEQESMFSRNAERIFSI